MKTPCHNCPKNIQGICFAYRGICWKFRLWCWLSDKKKIGE